MAEEDSEKEGKPKKKSIFRRIGAKAYFFLVVIALIAAGVYKFKGIFIAATVNKDIISRLELIQELEKQGGKQVLDGLINQKLILQEAQKQNITVSDDEISKKISEIEESVKSQGQSLDDVLASENLSRDELKERIRIQLMIEKLAGKDVEIGDEEISNYFESNKSYYAEGTELDSVKDSIKEQLKQQKISQNFQTLLQDLKDKGSIHYFIEL